MIWILIMFTLLEEWTCLPFEPFGEHPEKAFYRFRSMLQNHLSQKPDGAITGTFKFKEVNLTGNGSGPGKPAWNINGCFCHGAKSFCDCPSNPRAFRMVIKKKGARKQRKSTSSKRCYCDSRGCHGVGCERLSGCICDISGTCWGNKCPIDSTSAKETVPQSLHKKLNEDDTSAPNLPFSRQKIPSLVEESITKKEFLQESQTMNSLGQQYKLMSEQCNCNQDGCFGLGCRKMRGCACIGSKCWGNECKYGSLMNSYARPNKPDELESLSEHGMPVIKGYPVESIIGYPIETIKISQVDTIPQAIPVESQSLHPFDQTSVTPILQKSFSEIEKPTATGETMKTIIGSPIDSLIEMQNEGYPSQQVHEYGRHHSSLKSFADLKAVPIEKIRQNLHYFSNDRINPSNYHLEARSKQKSEEEQFYKRTDRNESL